MKFSMKKGMYQSLLVFGIFLLTFQLKSRIAPPPGGEGPLLPATPYSYSATIPASMGPNTGATIDYTALDDITDDGATLGRVLFYDKKISASGDISCGSCHKQELSFADDIRKSIGVLDSTERNSMALNDLGWSNNYRFFWDASQNHFHEALEQPFLNPNEMGQDEEGLLAAINQYDYYEELFSNAFGSSEVTMDRVTDAIGQFIKSINTFNSRFDQVNNDPEMEFTESELTGKLIFDLKCNGCHAFGNQTFVTDQEEGIDNSFFIFMDNGINDANDLGVNAWDPSFPVNTFKGRDLRNIELTAPYMHDGRLETLEDVVEFYNEEADLQGGPSLLFQISAAQNFTDEEKQGLIDFMKTMTDLSVTTDEKWSDPFEDSPIQQIQETVIEEVCEGENVAGYTVSGTYQDTFVTAEGIDSIRTLILTVHPNFVTELVESICEGGSINGHSTSGIYSDTFVSQFGCDSLVNLSLNVLEELSIDVNESICEGETFEGYSESGSYEDSFISVAGCDSIRTLNLEVVPHFVSDLSVEICEGEDYEGYTTSGLYEETFMSMSGCDSTVNVILTVFPPGEGDCEAVGLDESSRMHVSVYPNPSDQRMFIDVGVDGPKLIRVYSADMRLLLEDRFAPPVYEVDGASWTAGVYFVEVLFEGERVLKRVVFR